jgi:crotonobetainyl-CoA:carnitine CoA-transferase CaiB-like acyl-CoA transferase
MTARTAGPLAGLRVLDVSSAFMAPYCSLLLAQMGADVTKVEPLAGDLIRWVSPNASPGMGATFMVCNDGKRSIAVNLRSEPGQGVLARLVARSDVVVHNLRAAAAERCGLTYAQLEAHNPGIVVAATQGHAPDSPDAARPAYDDTIQASSGIAYLQGLRSGRPQYVTSIVADKSAALIGVGAILAAVYERQQTGLGQDIQIPMLEFMTSFALLEQLVGEVFVPNRGPAVYARTSSPHRVPYETRDGYLSVLLYTDRHWTAFFQAVGRDDLLADPRYSTIAGRTENIDELYGQVADILRSRTTSEWLSLLVDIDVPAAEVRSIDDLVHDPYLAQAGVLSEFQHPSEGTIRRLGLPVRFKNKMLEPPVRPAPRLGQDTFAVLAELGFSPADIDELAAAGIVAGEEPAADAAGSGPAAASSA